MEKVWDAFVKIQNPFSKKMVIEGIQKVYSADKISECRKNNLYYAAMFWWCNGALRTFYFK